MPYWPLRPEALHGEAGLVEPAAVDVRQVSGVLPRLPAVELGVKQREATQRRALIGAIPGAAVLGLVHAGASLETREAPPERWAVQLA